MKLVWNLLLLAVALGACSDDNTDLCQQDPTACQQSEAGVDQLLPVDLGPPADAAVADAAVGDVAPNVDLGTLPDGPVAAADAAQPYQHEHITAQTLKGWIAASKPMTLVDVRETYEFAAGHIQGATNLPWSSGVLKTQVGQLSSSASKPLVVYCQSGSRSNAAATWLVSQGLQPVYDMLGGYSGW